MRSWKRGGSVEGGSAYVVAFLVPDRAAKRTHVFTGFVLCIVSLLTDTLAENIPPLLWCGALAYQLQEHTTQATPPISGLGQHATIAFNRQRLSEQFNTTVLP